MAHASDTAETASTPRLSRRTALKLTGATAAVAASRRWSAPAVIRAQGLSGKITVSFEDTNGILAPAVDQAVQTVTAANAGSEIEVKQAPGGNFETQLFLALGTNRGPDVFALTGLGIGGLAAAGLLEPLTPRLDAWDGWAQYPDVVRNAITYQNTVWALPYILDTHFLYYRKDLFEKAGLPREWEPASLDDILAAARQVKSGLPDDIPYALYAGANGGNGTAIRGFLPLLYAYGGTMVDATGMWIIDSCPIRDTLAYYETAYQTDKTVPQLVMTDANPADTMRKALGSGELGIIFEGSWVYGELEKANPQDTHDNIGYLLFPAANGNPAFTVGGIGNCWYINAKSQNKDLAWEFVKAMLTKEVQVSLNVADPHIPARADAAADPAFQATPFLAAMVASVSALKIGPPDPAYQGLIGIVQNATGIVATGEATPNEAVQRYSQELTKALGADKVVSQPCP
ncbi:MAG TPA: sugar ABC transporter substrate-binding protein [Thermomicrobiales bacterium]|jgi:multiple sugar transport system substrate-binding protein